MLARSLLPALILLCAACAGPDPARSVPPAASGTDAATVSAHRFRFEDDGRALYFVVDKRADRARPPQTLAFVVPGSDCLSMGRFLPQYFDGLAGAGGLRIFILHKRHIDVGDDGRNCSTAFIDADHPSQWLADQSEFIAAQLQMAREAGQLPQRVLALGISEGGEVVPLLAQRFPEISHIAIIANGGMNPVDSFRIQASRHGFSAEADAVLAACGGNAPPDRAAGRSCRYWRELLVLSHTDNLLGLSRPILVAMGEKDPLVPAESAYFLAQRFADAGKTNLTTMVFPEADHALQKNKVSFLPYLWVAIDKWVME